MPYIVEWRRADIEKWMNSETPLPERQPAEERPYSLSPQYRDLYNSAITYLRGTFAEPPGLRGPATGPPLGVNAELNCRFFADGDVPRLMDSLFLAPDTIADCAGKLRGASAGRFS